MNEKGSISTEILVVLVVILLIIGITAKFSEITLDKLATSTENEKDIAHCCRDCCGSHFAICLCRDPLGCYGCHQHFHYEI